MSSTEKDAKTLEQILIEKAKKENGGCWMQDFIPLIKDATKAWLKQNFEDLQQPDHNPETRDSALILKGKELMIEKLLEDVTV